MKRARKPEPLRFEDAPTPELAQHHELTTRALGAVKDALRICTRLERLYIAGDIDDAEFTAGCQYRDDYEVAAGARDQGDASGVKTAYGSCTPSQRQIDAIARLRVIRQTHGPLAAWLLNGAVGEDRTFRDMAKEGKSDDKRIKRLVVDALKKIARDG